jgi:hypothetical protein
MNEKELLESFENALIMQRSFNEFKSNMKKRLKVAINFIEDLSNVNIKYNYKKCFATFDRILVDSNKIKYISLKVSGIHINNNYEETKIFYKDKLFVFRFVEIANNKIAGSFVRVNIPLFFLDENFLEEFGEIYKNIKLMDQIEKSDRK